MRSLLIGLSFIVLWGCGGDDTRSVPDATPMTDASTDAVDAMAPDATPDATVAPTACTPPATVPMDGMLGVVPEPLNEHTAAYFDSTREMIVFGGNTAIPVNCGFPAYVFLDTTWIFYDYENPSGQWTQVAGPGPSARGRHASAASDTTFYVHGGRWRTAGQPGPYTVLDDLWAFDIATRTWTEIVPADGNRPPGRYNAGLAYDSLGNRLWLFAGNASPNGATPDIRADLWVFDLNTMIWTQLVTGFTPEPRWWHNLVYDEMRDRLVVFGGGDERAFQVADYFNDVRALDLANPTQWQALNDGTVGTVPDGRFWGGMVHDTRTDRYVLFGGHDDTDLGNRNDTWYFDPNTNEWSMVTIGDELNSAANGFCDFPPDFTTIEMEVPERRNAGSFVYSEECGHSISFGGKTDCGAVNDVWRFANDTWAVEFSSGIGEACIRARGGADGCSSMCF
ncbi:MAG: kelch repeat-containing protein [Myxococcota bacterium]